MTKEFWIVFAVFLFVIVLNAIIMPAIKPKCPDGAHATLTRAGWYCTVAPIRAESR